MSLRSPPKQPQLKARTVSTIDEKKSMAPNMARPALPWECTVARFPTASSLHPRLRLSRIRVLSSYLEGAFPGLQTGGQVNVGCGWLARLQCSLQPNDIQLTRNIKNKFWLLAHWGAEAVGLFESHRLSQFLSKPLGSVDHCREGANIFFPVYVMCMLVVFAMRFCALLMLLPKPPPIINPATSYPLQHTKCSKITATPASLPITAKHGEQAQHPLNGQIQIRRQLHRLLFSLLHFLHSHRCSPTSVSSFPRCPPKEATTDTMEASILGHRCCLCALDSGDLDGVYGRISGQHCGAQWRRCGRFGRSRGKRSEGGRERGEDKSRCWKIGTSSEFSGWEAVVGLGLLTALWIDRAMPQCF